jgi:hypothetical protein
VLETLRVSGSKSVSVARVCCLFMACACELYSSASFALCLELKTRTFVILGQTLKIHACQADIVTLCFTILVSVSCAGSQQHNLPGNFERRVVMALKKHEGNACVASAAICLLASVMIELVQNAARKTEVENKVNFSCFATFAELVLLAEPNERQAANDACTVLAAASQVDVCPDNGHLITRRRAMLLLTTLTAHMSQLNVAQLVTGVIWRLNLLEKTFDDEDLKAVAEALVKAAMSHPSDGFVARNCFGALVKSAKRPRLLTLFRQVGGVESLSCWLMNCAACGMRARGALHMAEAREHAFALLAEVAYGQGNFNITECMLDSFCALAVLNVMSAFQESEHLACQGCWLISHLWSAMKARERAVYASRMARAALASVKKFSAKATVTRDGLNALSRILTDKAVLRDARLVKDCLMATAAAIEIHFQFSEVVENGMSVFAFASVLPENRAVVAAAGGVALAVKICRCKMELATVERCFVLLACMVNEDGVARALAEADILAVADKRLREHLTSETTLAQNCCHIIGRLAANDDYATKAQVCVPTLVAAIRVRARAASAKDMVACHACAALCEIANLRQGAARALHHKAASALMHALKSNPPTSGVAINAMATLLSIARSSESQGLTELVQAGAVEAALEACEVMAVARELLEFLAQKTASQGRVILLVEATMRVSSDNVRNALQDLRLPQKTDRERAEARKKI